jgi:NitT/TauT family transport system substrate-binding protein
MHDTPLRRLRWGVAALAVVVTSLSSPGAGAQTATWRHGLISAHSDAGFFFMVQNGFAEKQGLKLEIVQFKTDITALQSLIAGDLDSFEAGPASSMVAAARGGDIKIIGCNWQALPYVIYARKAIGSLADLKGKTVAISAPAGFPAVIARGILEKNGVPPDSVNFANLGADVERYKAVLAGVADAAVVSDEYEPIVEQQGLKALVASKDAFPDYIRQCAITTGKTLATRRDGAVRFMMAEMTALRYALSHRDEALRLTREMTGLKADDPRPEFVYDQALRTHAVDPEWPIPMAKLQWMQEQLIREGSIKQGFDPATVVDAGVRAKALELLAAK